MPRHIESRAARTVCSHNSRVFPVSSDTRLGASREASTATLKSWNIRLWGRRRQRRRGRDYLIARRTARVRLQHQRILYYYCRLRHADASRRERNKYGFSRNDKLFIGKEVDIFKRETCLLSKFRSSHRSRNWYPHDFLHRYVSSGFNKRDCFIL